MEKDKLELLSGRNEDAIRAMVDGDCMEKLTADINYGFLTVN